ncbi:hypothetical protein CUMW_261200 [Citrus unshiu]|uniref:60S ribosomal protein L36 n=1 Tax=Citrus unshiu TaxID=55188 RepID=A0A2H5QTW6_CITUN|nr:hypothetical protein CUMW_261200 [Citrus unshiu]
MALKQPNTSLFVRSNKGHVVTKKELPRCLADGKGKTSKIVHFERNVIRQVGKYKSALKLAKRKLSTHKRAKMKSEEMSSVLRRIRATRGGEKKK